MSAHVWVRRARWDSGWWAYCCSEQCCVESGFMRALGRYPTASAALDAACEHIRATQPTREPTVFERAMGATG